MAWYWVALIGGLLSPLVVMPRDVLRGFMDGGLAGGLGAWSGIAVITLPITFVLMWIGVTLLF